MLTRDCEAARAASGNGAKRSTGLTCRLKSRPQTPTLPRPFADPRETTMNSASSRNHRLKHLYNESATLLAAGYAQLNRRLLELEVTSVRSQRAIEQSLRRLNPRRE